MQKIYSRINWENEPSTNTPLSENNLNKIDYALDVIDNRVVDLYGYQDRVEQAEKNAKTSETNAKTSETNAKQSELKAKEYMENAFNGTPEGYQEVVEKVDRMEIKTTKENTIKGTKNGGFRLTKVVANTIQNGTPSPSTPVPLLSTGECVELMVGAYWTTDGKYVSNNTFVCNKYPIPCKKGDVLTIELEKECDVYFLGYNDSGYIGYVKSNSNKVHTYTIPNDTLTYLNFDVLNTNVMNTIDDIGKITIKINGKYVVGVRTYFSADMMQGRWVVSNGVYETNALFVCSKNPIPCKGGDVIKLNGDKKYYYNVVFYNGDKFLSDSSTSSTTLSHECIAPSNATKFAVNVGDANGVTPQTVGNITLTINGVGETVAHILTNEPLRKGDIFYKENGLWKVERNAKEISMADLTFGSAVDKGEKQVYTCSTFSTNRKHSSIDITCMSNAFVSYKDHNDVQNRANVGIAFNMYTSYLNYLYVCVPTDLLETHTAQNFRQWLADNDVKLLYWLATPIIEVLDTQSQIALNGLETFNGVTHIEFDSRVQPLGFESESGTSQVGAYTLQALNNSESNAVRLNELAVAIVSL